jgi:hypothetical protein
MTTSRALENGQNESNAAGGTRMISRRTVVRTGVTAAWSVPLIQVVGAAPALAVSGSKIGVSGGQAVWDGNYINVTVPLSNSGTQQIDTITITLTFSTGLTPEPNSATGGWVASKPVVMDGKTTITYSTTTARLRAGRTISPTFVVKDKDHKGAAGSVTVAVVTSSGSASGFYTIAAVTGGGGKS